MNEKWLIDANSICRGCPSYEDCKGECWSEGECEIYDVLAKAPTLTYADLVPHGRWDFVDQRFYDGGFVDIYICTSCGLSNDGKSIYCPNCGAKMDGGIDNGQG